MKELIGLAVAGIGAYYFFLRPDPATTAGPVTTTPPGTAPPPGGTTAPPGGTAGGSGGTTTPPATTPPPGQEPGASQPGPGASIASCTVSLLTLATLAPDKADVAGNCLLTADQWNYYRNASHPSDPPQSTDLFPVGNRGYLMTAAEYHQRRAAAGLPS